MFLISILFLLLPFFAFTILEKSAESGMSEDVKSVIFVLMIVIPMLIIETGYLLIKFTSVALSKATFIVMKREKKTN